MNGTVRSVMQPQPVTVSVNSTIEDAALAMRSNDIGDVLVTDGTRLHGILTDRDIVVRAIAMGRHPAATLASECCGTELQSMGAHESTERGADIMRQHALRRLPVIDDGQLVGTVSLGDVAVAAEPESTLSDVSAAPPNRYSGPVAQASVPRRGATYSLTSSGTTRSSSGASVGRS